MSCTDSYRALPLHRCPSVPCDRASQNLAGAGRRPELPKQILSKRATEPERRAGLRLNRRRSRCFKPPSWGPNSVTTPSQTPVSGSLALRQPSVGRICVPAVWRESLRRGLPTKLQQRRPPPKRGLLPSMRVVAERIPGRSAIDAPRNVLWYLADHPQRLARDCPGFGKQVKA